MWSQMYDLSTTTMIWEECDHTRSQMCIVFATTMVYASDGKYRATCVQ